MEHTQQQDRILMSLPEIMNEQAIGFHFVIGGPMYVGEVTFDGNQYHCDFMHVDGHSCGNLTGYAETTLSLAYKVCGGDGH